MAGAKLPGVSVGVEYLPRRMKEFLLSQVKTRPRVPKVHHITALTGCLRKSFYRGKYPESNSFSLESCLNIFRGVTFDKILTSIFPVHQTTFRSTRRGVTLTGTLDFVVEDEELGEKVLYDLKAPKTTFFIKSGPGRIGYQRQVQAYLALAKANGGLRDVKRCRVLSIAGDVVVHEYGEAPDILDSFFWPRAFVLDAALETGDPGLLFGPEEKWECREEFCPADVDFRIECARVTVPPPVKPVVHIEPEPLSEEREMELLY